MPPHEASPPHGHVSASPLGHRRHHSDHNDGNGVDCDHDSNDVAEMLVHYFEFQRQRQSIAALDDDDARNDAVDTTVNIDNVGPTMEADSERAVEPSPPTAGTPPKNKSTSATPTNTPVKSVNSSHTPLQHLQSTPTRRQEQPTKKRVTFSSLQIRGYSQVLGDHPCCTNGPPISLGWKYMYQEDFHDLAVYERRRPPRRTRRQLKMSCQVRRDILLQQQQGDSTKDNDVITTDYNNEKENSDAMMVTEIDNYAVSGGGCRNTNIHYSSTLRRGGMVGPFHGETIYDSCTDDYGQFEDDVVAVMEVEQEGENDEDIFSSTYNNDQGAEQQDGSDYTMDDGNDCNNSQDCEATTSCSFSTVEIEMKRMERRVFHDRQATIQFAQEVDRSGFFAMALSSPSS